MVAKVTLASDRTLSLGSGSISLSFRSELLLARCCLESHLGTLLIPGSSFVQRACLVPQATALGFPHLASTSSSLPPSQLLTIQSCLAASKACSFFQGLCHSLKSEPCSLGDHFYIHPDHPGLFPLSCFLPFNTMLFACPWLVGACPWMVGDCPWKVAD